MLYGTGMGMGMLVPDILQLVKLSVIGFIFIIRGPTGYGISPAPSNFSEIPPIEGALSPVHQKRPLVSDAPSSESQPNGSNFRTPVALPPHTSSPMPQITAGLTPSYSPSPPTATPTHNTAPPPLSSQGHVPSLSPSIPRVSAPYNVAPSPFLPQTHAPLMPLNASRRKIPVRNTPVSVRGAPVPAATPSRNEPQISPVIHPNTPKTSVPSARNTSLDGAPVEKPIAPVACPRRESGQNQPAVHMITPAIVPSVSSDSEVSPMGDLPHNSPASPPIMPGEPPSMLPDIFHSSAPSPSSDREKDGSPVAAAPKEAPKPSPPVNHSPPKAPSTHNSTRHTNEAPVPSMSLPKTPPNEGNLYYSPASSPFIPFHKQNPEWSKINGPAPASSHLMSPHSSKHPAAAIPPSFIPTKWHTHYAPPPVTPGSSAATPDYPFSKPLTGVSPASSPSSTAASGWTKIPILAPKVSPYGSSSSDAKIPPLPPVQAFPPPPPNEDCSATVCVEPYTNTPPGSPCSCVLPMQVGLSLSVALYTFFPLVSELAQEIAAGVFMKQSQVRIIGANAGGQEPEKTIVLIDLVPLGERFDNTTAFLTYQRFWHKQVVIDPSLFGDYEVLYVRYTGLPPSPPLPPSSITIIGNGPYSGNNNNARTMKPLGVDVHKKKPRDGLSGGMIAIIALSGSVALFLWFAIVWALLFRHRDPVSQPEPTLQPLPPAGAKPTGATASIIGRGVSSASLSFGSSIAAYKGSAKTFSASDIERATKNFDPSRILGEGGFGRVYSGILEDGTSVAVKVLKRDDQHGGREFLAEVEMLSRLHHRNLVKLIGICTEERARSLVYELIPNGSVESHLHGIDKECASLDWNARIKIALGAAQGLAYLHEDSSPRVIHRDFKASNILLEHDFTPKVSDFGLARTAMDEENRHISTHVVGTFGYVAPEYAMTGHLLVKSDVYSYGVVLLELLTGRKPVDMSQPPGQENLVAWARPLLTSTEGLKTIIDPSLGSNVPFDSVAKVAAIASMCVQPEVSHRPFMGEVVQALKLVCNECDEAKEVDSKSSSRDLFVNVEAGISVGSRQLPEPFENQTLVPNYNSEPDIERGLSMTSVRYGRQASGSFGRCFSSGQLRMGRGKRLWQKMRRSTGGSVNEHGVIFRQWPGSH